MAPADIGRIRGRSGLAAAAAMALGVALATTASCGQTPTEFSPLVRAIGEVRGLLMRFDGLAQLPDDGRIYEAWALRDRNRANSLGRFLINAAGEPIDADGNVIESFTTEEINLRDSIGVLVTVELPGDNDANPSNFQILQGPFINGVASLTVPGPVGIGDAAGSYRVFTPTDGPRSNESSGLWAIDEAGEPTLSLPTSTVGFTYEAFVIVNGTILTMGRFANPEAADSINFFSGEGTAPEVPGEDFLTNAPEGLTFPLDLSGATVRVTLEASSNDLADPSQLVILEAALPAGLNGGETVSLLNRSDEFPTGRAVLF